MIKHIVMWNVRGVTREEKQAALRQLKGAFEGLRGRVPGMTLLEIGLDHSRVDYACDVVLYSEFESQAALDAYAEHPAHVQVRQALEGVRIARHQVDYAAGEPTGFSSLQGG